MAVRPAPCGLAPGSFGEEQSSLNGGEGERRHRNLLRRLNAKSHLILFELELAIVVVIYTHLGTYPCSSCQQGRLIALWKRSRAKGKTSAAEAAHRQSVARRAGSVGSRLCGDAGTRMP